MGAHLIEGEFQSDKYPTCPRGKVPLSVKDETAQDLLWEYAQRRREVDEEFSDDLEAALRAAKFVPTTSLLLHRVADAAGCPDYESFHEVIARVQALHNAVLGSHRQVTAPDGGADFCADCGMDIEDAVSDGLLCLADSPVTVIAPTDAEWYSLLAAMARGDSWPSGPGSLGDARRCLRAALDKINSLEQRLAHTGGAAPKLYVFTDGAEYVIAHDREDANKVWSEFTGEPNCTLDWEEPLGDQQPLVCWRYKDGGGIAEPNEEGAEEIERSAADWCAREERGYFCTTEA